MNTNKILIAGLIGGVFSFFFGWLLYGFILHDMMPNHVEGLMKDEGDMIWWAMIVSNLAFGVLLAYVFVQWANISTWMNGLKAGAILGLLIALYYDFSFFSMTNMMTMSDVIIDIVAATVYTGVTGAVIGWWLGRK